MQDGDVLLQGVKMIREVDDTLVCLIGGQVRFIPTAHIRSRGIVQPGDVGTITIPRWLAESLGLT